MKIEIVTIFLLVSGFVSQGRGQNLAGFTVARDQCDNVPVLSQPEAQAIISTSLDLSEAGGRAFGCGEPAEGAIKIYEALLWAVNRINQDSGSINGEPVTDSYVPGIKIGLVVSDTCSTPARSTVDFNVFEDLQSRQSWCTHNSSQIALGALSGVKPLSSVASIGNFPKLSFTDSSDDTDGFAFMRTVPPNREQAEVVLQVLNRTQETVRSAVVYTMDQYGKDGYKDLVDGSARVGVCFTTTIPVPLTGLSDDDYQSIIRQLLSKQISQAVFVGDPSTGINLLKAAEMVPDGGKVQWIFSSTLGGDSNMVEDVKFARGMISVSPAVRHIAEFEDYYVRIDPNNPPAQDPFYKEAFMWKSKCRLNGINYPPYNGFPDCVIPSEQDRREEFTMGPYVESAITGIYTYGRALKDAQAAKCGSGSRGLCPELADMQQEEFYNNYLMGVDFTFTKEERIPTLASSQIEPFLAAKRVRYTASGDLADPMFDVYNYNRRTGTFKFDRVGTARDGQLSDLFGSRYARYDVTRDNLLSVCLSCASCKTETCADCVAGMSDAPQHLLIPGDVIIGGLFPVHNKGQGNTCGDLNREGADMAHAFVYAIEQLPDMNILQGVNIGGLAFDSCSSSTRVTNMLRNFNSGLYKVTQNNGMTVDPWSVHFYMAGDTGDNAAALSVTGEIQAPQVAFQPISSVLLGYPTTSSASPSVTTVLKSMVAFADYMDWRYAQVVSDESLFGHHFVDQLKNEGSKKGICIGADYYNYPEVSFQNVVDEIVKNLEARVLFINLSPMESMNFLKALNSSGQAANFIVFSVQALSASPSFSAFSRTIRTPVYSAETIIEPSAGYANYLRSLRAGSSNSNPWFDQWYEQGYSCSLDNTNMRQYTETCENVGSTPISNSPSFEPNYWSASVINSVTLTAQALHKTLQVFCGDNYNGICSEFWNEEEMGNTFMQHLRDITFTDDQGNDMRVVNGQAKSNIDLKMLSQGANVQVATYKTDSDTLEIQYNLGNNDAIQCTGQCSECSYQYRMQTFMEIPGDVMIGGIFNVHASDDDSPFNCGSINVEEGFQYTEALRYAIDMMNKGDAPVRLSGVTLGGYALDGCSSPLRSDNLVSSLYSGGLVLKDDMMSDVDVGKVKGWLVYGDENSAEVGSTLGKLGVPVVSPDSTSTEINENIDLYPTLFRSSSSDDNLADAMVKLLNNLGWKYIQVVYSTDTYGMTGLKTLTKNARSADICVRSSYEIKEDTNIEELVANLATSSSTVVVVFASTDLITKLMMARDSAGDAAKDLVFVTSKAWGIEAGTTANDNSIAFDFSTPDIEAFDEFMAQQKPVSKSGNPWFDEYYQAIYQCNLGKDFSYPRACASPADNPAVWADGYKQDPSVYSTLLSVYALAGALDLVLKELCGDSYSGLCPEFTENDAIMEMMVEKMKEVSFFTPERLEFKYVDGQFKSVYTVSRLFNGNMLRAGRYYDGQLRITDANMANVYSDVETTCDGACLECRYGSITDESFTFIPGDIILGGVFDVHERGDSPYDCGSMNMNQGFQLLEAFNYAIGVVNSKKGLFAGKLGGLTIGGLGLDACESSTRASTLVSNIHAGYLPIMNGNDQVNPGRIDGYVGSLTSDISADIAHILNVLGIPQVSYGATSSVFTDKNKYPYFLRTVPGDSKLARAIVAILNKFDLKYVQVVNSPGTYGEEAAAELVKHARQRGVCVAQTITLPPRDLTNESADKVIETLSGKPRAKVVIMFVNDKDINPLLSAAQRSSQGRTFRFIGSETWNDNKDVLKDVEDAAANSITLAVETADLVSFDRYLDAKTPASYTSNPWFSEYYEEVYECSLTPGSSKFSQECSDPDRGVVRGRNYEQDPYVLYTVNAVYAVALGIDYAIEEACGSGYFGMCEAFRNMGERRQKILEGIKKAKFVDATGQTFDFDIDGESNRGYHIYTVVSPVTGQGLYYSNVGSYNDTHLLRIDSGFDVDWESNCEDPGACDECPSLGRQSTRYMQQESPENLNIVGFFDVHSSDPKDSLKCGSLDPNGGIQNALAFFYAISEINKNTDLNFRPEIKLGGIAIDTCDNKLRVSQDIYAVLMGDNTCGISSNLDPSSVMVYMTSGNDATEAAADLLSPRGVTVITPDASGVDLSEYDTLLSVVPTSDLEAAALRDLIAQMGWSYVSVISSSEYDTLTTAFMDADAQRATCVAKNTPLQPGASVSYIQAHLRDISQQTGARVVVLFTSPKQTNMIFQAAKEEDLDGKLQFVVAGSGFSDTINMPKGTMTIQARSAVSKGFNEWLDSLNLVNHDGIPDDWFEEFWQHALQCKLENSSVIQDYTRICLATEKLSDFNIAQLPSVLHTIIATFMIAQGLDAIPECRNQQLSIAGCLSQFPEKNQLIYEYISKSEYRVLPQQVNNTFTFSFTDGSYGNLGYDIRNYRHNDNGDFTLVKVGTWQNQLRLNLAEVRVYDSDGEQRTVVSRCPTGTACTCVNTDDPINGGGGVGGGGGGNAHPLVATSSVDMEDRVGEIWGIVIVALTGVGILVSICSLVYLMIFYPNRSGTTILGYVLLVGVLCMYTLVFAFILYPDEIVCSIRKFCLGFVYAICFSCMLVKVLNTWRVGAYINDYPPPSYKRLAHPGSLFCIAFALVCVQIIIGVEWLILEDTNIELFEITDDNEIVPRCSPVDDHNIDLILSCVYVFILIVLTAIFASITWDSVDGHRESRWIAITTFMTVGIVLVWTIMSTLTDEKYREPVIAVALLVNATVILLCIFVRKIYLLNKIQKQIDEDEKRSAYTHSLHGERENELYSTLHTNHAYDVNVDGISNRGSHAGSGVMYVYNGGADMQF